MKKKLVLLALLAAGSVAARQDKVHDMIRRIDTDGINEIYIPGLFISQKEKKRYQKKQKQHQRKKK